MLGPLLPALLRGGGYRALPQGKQVNLTQWFLTQGSCVLQGTLGTLCRHSWLLPFGWCHWHLMDGGRGHCWTSYKAQDRAPPPIKDYLLAHVSSTKAPGAQHSDSAGRERRPEREGDCLSAAPVGASGQCRCVSPDVYSSVLSSCQMQ